MPSQDTNIDLTNQEPGMTLERLESKCRWMQLVNFPSRSPEENFRYAAGRT